MTGFGTQDACFVWPVAFGLSGPRPLFTCLKQSVGRVDNPTSQGLWQSGRFVKALICLSFSAHAQYRYINSYDQITQSVFVFQTEIAFRRAVWEKNMQLVLRHNQEASAGKHSFTMGLNHLADMVGNKQFMISVCSSENKFSECSSVRSWIRQTCLY